MNRSAMMYRSAAVPGAVLSEEAAVRAHEGDLVVGIQQGAELGEEGRGPAGRAGVPTPQPDARDAVRLGEHRKEGMVGLRSTSRKAPAATRFAM